MKTYCDCTQPNAWLILFGAFHSRIASAACNRSSTPKCSRCGLFPWELDEEQQKRYEEVLLEVKNSGKK